MNPDLPGEYRLLVHPTRQTQGMTVPVTFEGEPIVVRLRRGLSASGVVIEGATGQPIPDIDLTLRPHYRNEQAKFSMPIKTVTDAAGRFRLDNLEPGVYAVHSDDVLAVSTQIIQEHGRTIYRSHGPGLTITAGEHDQELRVQFRPGRKRAPADRR